jgi:hypothetical protein
MKVDDIDQALAHLDAAAQTVGEQLVRIERDPLRTLLGEASLTGETARQWAEASATLSDLWQWFARLKDVLAEATGLRSGSSRLSPDRAASIEALLKGASIPLRTNATPLPSGPPQGRTPSCTPEELLALMPTAMMRTESLLAAVGGVWDRLFARLQGAEASLDELQGLAASLGEDAQAELAVLRSSLARFGETLRSDPLAVDDRMLGEIEVRLASKREDLDAAGRLRDELRQRLQTAYSVIEALRDAAEQSARAYREVTAKIIGSHVPRPLAIGRSLTQRLEAVEALAHAGEWLTAQRELGEWTSAADALLLEHRENAASIGSPLEERNQLRGLLDAYRAKAAGIGRIEDRRLTSLYEAAHAALYHAPTDLRTASDLVRQYQDAISGSSVEKAPS